MNCCGCGQSFEKSSFDPPKPAPPVGSFEPLLISLSHLYCLVQHVAEWPQFYCFVDCRSLKAFDKSHIVGAEFAGDVAADRANEVTVILYDERPTAPGIQQFFEKISSCEPMAIYILDANNVNQLNIIIDTDVLISLLTPLSGSFAKFKKKYKTVIHTFTQTTGEQPGPVELIPATKQNPAVYSLHRNQFQHCKTTIAYLGCTTVINLSSRRLFLKTAAIQLENVQFDATNEPYDEAIASFLKHVNQPPKSSTKGNILMIDEAGCDYAALLAGWYWYKGGFDLEEICSHLSNKMGNLDPWYLDVLRAWTESE